MAPAPAATPRTPRESCDRPVPGVRRPLPGVRCAVPGVLLRPVPGVRGVNGVADPGVCACLLPLPSVRSPSFARLRRVSTASRRCASLSRVGKSLISKRFPPRPPSPPSAPTTLAKSIGAGSEPSGRGVARGSRIMGVPSIEPHVICGESPSTPCFTCGERDKEREEIRTGARSCYKAKWRGQHFLGRPWCQGSIPSPPGSCLPWNLFISYRALGSAPPPVACLLYHWSLHTHALAHSAVEEDDNENRKKRGKMPAVFRLAKKYIVEDYDWFKEPWLTGDVILW